MGKRIKLTVFLAIVFTLGICVYNNYEQNKDEVKGGFYAISPYEFKADDLELKNNENVYTLTGDDKKNFIYIIKGIKRYNIENSENDDLEVDNHFDYDVDVDFKNGTEAKISFNKKIISFDGYQYKISDYYINRIKEYMK